ncbi:MAG: CoA transferase [Chloroflexi bacterium]|nr:CoA transferase [Chloroflexota bacterium]
MSQVSLFSSLTILSIEQATTLPYFTLRLAQEGARVIRIENPPHGDPNRWVGPKVIPTSVGSSDYEEGMNAYFLPNNLGKQSITLNLGEAKGRDLLHRLINELSVDIFATNQRPKSMQKLGVDYNTLIAIKPDLIWLSITGFGPQINEAAYDPILQARAGFMDITGEAAGDPMVFGLPIVDLGAGEHAYGQIMKALYRRSATGEGSRIDISMFQSAVSWTLSPAMLSTSFKIPIERRGNTHRFFAPVSVFPTSDGAVYFAVGNDRQWDAIMQLEDFESLANSKYENNAGRINDANFLNQKITEITKRKNTDELLKEFTAIGVPISKVNSFKDVCEDPLIRDYMVTARDPISEIKISIPPPPVIPDFLHKEKFSLDFPPRLGEHNELVFGEIGIDVQELESRGII